MKTERVLFALAGQRLPSRLMPVGDDDVQAILDAPDVRFAADQTRIAADKRNASQRSEALTFWTSVIVADALIGALILWLASITPLSAFLSVPLYALAITIVPGSLLLYAALSSFFRQYEASHPDIKLDPASVRRFLTQSLLRFVIFREIELVLSALAVALLGSAFSLIGSHAAAWSGVAQNGLGQLFGVVDKSSLWLADFLFATQDKSPRELMLAKLSLWTLSIMGIFVTAWIKSQAAKIFERRVEAGH